MGLTVTQLATPSVVRIHHCPPKFDLLIPIYRNRQIIIVAEVAQLIEH